MVVAVAAVASIAPRARTWLEMKPAMSVATPTPASHGHSIASAPFDATPTRSISRSGRMPQERSVIAAAFACAPPARTERAAPTVDAVLETSPPRSPVASVPARAPSSVCAMYPARLNATTRTTSIHAARGFTASNGPSARSGSTGNTTSASKTKMAIARTSPGASRRITAWSGSRM